LLIRAGRYVAAYTFSTTTTNSDPGSGVLRLNSATQNAATEMFVDDVSAQGDNIRSYLDRINNGGAGINAYMTLIQENNLANYLVFEIGAVTTSAGYLNMVILDAVASSAASPFANAAALLMYVTPTAPYDDFPLATQSQQEAGTSLTTLVAPGVQHFHPSACKAWVRFRGDTAGIFADFNVLSVVNDSTGRYTVNWDTDFSGSSDQAVFTSVYDDGANTGEGKPDNSTGTASSIQIVYRDRSAGAGYAPSRAVVCAFGDL
jgi:hypothetical protein